MRCLKQGELVAILVCLSFVAVFVAVVIFAETQTHRKTCRQDYYKCGGEYECAKYNCTECVNPLYIPEYVCAGYEDNYSGKLAAFIILTIILFCLLIAALRPSAEMINDFVSFVRRYCCQRYQYISQEI